MSGKLAGVPSGGGGSFTKAAADLLYVALSGSTPGAMSAEQQFVMGLLLGNTSTQVGFLDLANGTNAQTLRIEFLDTVHTAGAGRPMKLALLGNIGIGGFTLTLRSTNGTMAYLGDKLSAFAATSSAELMGVISDETGSGPLVFGNSPTLTTPTENGVKAAVRALTADATLAATDYIVTVDATGGNVIVTLPATSGGGQMFRLKRLDASVNTVTIAAGGGNTIDGAASILLATQYTARDLVDTAAAAWSVF